jgi:hypothetical protein
MSDASSAREYAVAGVAKSDVTRIPELTNETRSGSEQYSCLVAIRDDEGTERRQSDRFGSEGSGDFVSRRFGCP